MRRSSPAHPLVPGSPSELTTELIVRLRDPFERDRTGLFAAEGARFLIKALECGDCASGALLCRPLIPPTTLASLVERLKRNRVPFRYVSRPEFVEAMSALEPSGVFVVCRQHWQTLAGLTPKRDIWLGIEHLRTHGNVGTLMRSAAATGASGLIIFGPARDRTDPFDPLTVRASMGAIFGLRLVKTSHTEFRRWKHRSDYRVIGAAGEAATDYRAVSYRKPVVLMLGNERTGLSDAQRETCDAFVRIPMAADVDSLNVAMAGTVLLYEAFGQRHPFRRGGV